MSARACFRCGHDGHQARNCPNQDGKAKALEQAGVPVKTFIGCLGCDDFVPAHRITNRKLTPLARARDFAQVTRRVPQGCTMGECIGDAFARLASLEKEEDRHEDEDDGVDPTPPACVICNISTRSPPATFPILAVKQTIPAIFPSCR